MQQPARTRFAVVTVAITAVLLGVAFLLLQLTSPSDGARLDPSQPAWRSDGIIVTPLQEQPGGLRQGDEVVAVAGSSMESWARALFQPGAPRPHWQFGQTVTYTIVRSGQHLDVPVTLGHYPLAAILIHEWSTVLFALVFLCVAAFVFLLRPDDRAARVQLLIAASITGATTWSLGLQVGDLVNGVGFWLYIATTFGVYTLFWVGLLHFALVFPQPHPVVVKRPWVIPLIYIVPYALSFAYFAGVWPGTASTLDWIGSWGTIESVLPAIYLVLTIVIVIWGYRTLRTTADRQKIRWLMFAGLVCGGSTFFLWYLPSFILGQPLLNSDGLGLLVLPYPLVLPIAILRYRLFDIDVLINRTLVYGILTASVVGVYVLVVSTLGTLLHTSGSSALAPWSTPGGDACSRGGAADDRRDRCSSAQVTLGSNCFEARRCLLDPRLLWAFPGQAIDPAAGLPGRNHWSTAACLTCSRGRFHCRGPEVTRRYRPPGWCSCPCRASHRRPAALTRAIGCHP